MMHFWRRKRRRKFWYISCECRLIHKLKIYSCHFFFVYAIFLSSFFFFNWISACRSFFSIFNRFAFTLASLFTPDASWDIVCNCDPATERFSRDFATIFMNFPCFSFSRKLLSSILTSSKALLRAPVSIQEWPK